MNSKEIKIIKKETKQQNKFYDERRAANGGGYDQPLVDIYFIYNNKKYLLEYDNQSCGDFGRRWSLIIEDAESEKTMFYYDCDFVNSSDYEYFEFDDEFREIYKDLSDSEELGDYFPTWTIEDLEKRLKEREDEFEEEEDNLEEDSFECSGSEEIEEECEEA